MKPATMAVGCCHRTIPPLRFPASFNQQHPKPRSLLTSKRLPAGSWDSHVHVILPSKFPLVADAEYHPPSHTISEAIDFEHSLGIQRMVLVQPSCYGNDNSCMIDALKRLGPVFGRGVVSFDPWTISTDQLAHWHQLGVRGVRVNLQSVGKRLSKYQLRRDLERCAHLILPYDWAIQLYVPMGMVALLEDILPRLQVKTCLDHFGSPPIDALGSKFSEPSQIPGFNSLVSLLQRRNTWVKISAQYRLSNDPDYRDLEVLFDEFAAVAPQRLIYGTDWPHTRFEDIDSNRFAKTCLRWASKSGIVDSLFRDAAIELWAAQHDLNQ